MRQTRDTRTPFGRTRLQRLGQLRHLGLAAGAGLVLCLALPAAAEEPAKGGLVTSTASPRVDAPAPQPAPGAASPAASRATPTEASKGMQPPAAPAPGPADPRFERMEAEAELAAAHARLKEADAAVSVMLRRNYPRGDSRAELFAEQAEAERSFHEAQAAVDRFDSRDGW